MARYSLSTPVSSINKTDRRDIIKLLLNVVLYTINHQPNHNIYSEHYM